MPPGFNFELSFGAGVWLDLPDLGPTFVTDPRQVEHLDDWHRYVIRDTYQQQEFRMVMRGKVCDVSFLYEWLVGDLYCYCTCDGWTDEEGCEHVERVAGGDARGVSGDGDLATVRLSESRRSSPIMKTAT